MERSVKNNGHLSLSSKVYCIKHLVLSSIPESSVIHGQPRPRTGHWHDHPGISNEMLTQTLVSLRRRFMRWTLFSMTVGLVISVAQLAGNQPLSPSRILSP